MRAIISGPRTSERPAKRAIAALAVTKSDHTVNEHARCELDTRADTICAGINFRLLSLTGQTCEVKGFHQAFEALRDIPVAQVASAVTINGGKTVVLIINEALYFGNQLDHSLINPNQIRSFGIPVSDDPFDHQREFGIDYDEDCFIPFSTEGCTVYFDSYVPSDEQLETCRLIELTDSREWDPASVDLVKRTSETKSISTMSTMIKESDLCFESDLHLSSILECLSPALLAQRLIESVQIDRTQSQVVSNTRHSALTPERISQIFGIGLHTAKQTLVVTTQRGIRHATHPLN